MRTTAGDQDNESTSTSCVVDSLVENETNKTVGVNKCVNISSNSYHPSLHDGNKFLLSNQTVIDDAPIYESIASELDEVIPLRTSNDEPIYVPIYDVPKGLRVEDDVLHKFLFNEDNDHDGDDDDDDLTSSKYLDVPCSRGYMLQPANAPAARTSEDNPRYIATRDNNNKEHKRAVRKNFSLWIGVTSCVWGLLLLFMKNYAE